MSAIPTAFDTLGAADGLPSNYRPADAVIAPLNYTEFNHFSTGVTMLPDNESLTIEVVFELPPDAASLRNAVCGWANGKFGCRLTNGRLLVDTLAQQTSNSVAVGGYVGVPLRFTASLDSAGNSCVTSLYNEQSGARIITASVAWGVWVAAEFNTLTTSAFLVGGSGGGTNVAYTTIPALKIFSVRATRNGVVVADLVPAANIPAGNGVLFSPLDKNIKNPAIRPWTTLN